jgi:hypothetical protein
MAASTTAVNVVILGRGLAKVGCCGFVAELRGEAPERQHADAGYQKWANSNETYLS